ncbi:MAG: hypothetical protein GX112_06850 [Clostridiaceae bacterium]|jgi:hypothetical protein|nr:hypothetical protein [Clostridiaceae bacterium]
MAHKVTVRVLAEFDEHGQLLPRAITWADGRRYCIDRILDVRQAASLKVGGSGMRYTCRIHGQEVYLFRDDNHWFMEGR